MQRYIAQRLGLSVISLLGLSMIIFVLLRAVPGDAALFLAGEDTSLSGVELEALRDELGLSDPLVQQYFSWLSDIVRGDLGESLFTGETVVGALRSRLPVSLELGFMALLFAVLIAFPVGIISALKQDSWTDQALRFASILGLAVPNFWLATMTLVFGSRWFGWVPPVGYSTIFEDPGRNLQQFIIPALILGTALSASLSRMLRSSMLEVMREDYIRTARAKGLSTSLVIRKHMLKNALIPVITLLGVQAGAIIGGTVIIESIFSLPGMGRLIIDAINRRDYPLVQGIVLAFGAGILLINLLTDLTYGWLDPRISYS